MSLFGAPEDFAKPIRVSLRGQPQPTFEQLRQKRHRPRADEAKETLDNVVAAGLVDEAYERVVMPSDNNCQFHALSYMLKHNYPSERYRDMTQSKLRRILCDYLAHEMPELELPITAMVYVGQGRIRDEGGGGGAIEVVRSSAIESLPQKSRAKYFDTETYSSVYARNTVGQMYEISDSDYEPIAKCYEDKVWGNQQTLEAAAKKFQVRVAVVSQGYNTRGESVDRVTYVEPREGTEPLATWIVNHTSGVHYDVLMPRQ